MLQTNSHRGLPDPSADFYRLAASAFSSRNPGARLFYVSDKHLHAPSDGGQSGLQVELDDQGRYVVAVRLGATQRIVRALMREDKPHFNILEGEDIDIGALVGRMQTLLEARNKQQLEVGVCFSVTNGGLVIGPVRPIDPLLPPAQRARRLYDFYDAIPSNLAGKRDAVAVYLYYGPVITRGPVENGLGWVVNLPGTASGVIEAPSGSSHPYQATVSPAGTIVKAQGWNTNDIRDLQIARAVDAAIREGAREFKEA